MYSKALDLYQPNKIQIDRWTSLESFRTLFLNNDWHFHHEIYSPFTIFQKEQLRELFRTAATRQTEIMVQNILGNGIDIPLLGLREASREVEGELHELFTDECYKIANCFLLSTSQVNWIYGLYISLNVSKHKLHEIKINCVYCTKSFSCTFM